MVIGSNGKNMKDEFPRGSELERRALRILARARELSEIGPETLAAEASLMRRKDGKHGPADADWAFTLGAVSSIKSGLTPFHSQVHAALAMADGKIAEMKTGEGKTLSIILTAFYLSLNGTGVHVVTANPYLARRDAVLARRVLGELGTSVGVLSGVDDADERRAAYACDVTYGTTADFGFDYLRDTVRPYGMRRLQKGLPHAIVDEADSVLIDEATIPLVLSSPGKVCEAGQFAEGIAAMLSEGEDYQFDGRERVAWLTETGAARVGKIAAELGCSGENFLFDGTDPTLAGSLHSALNARLFKRDIDYVVSGGRVIPVDPATGRAVPSRKFGNGIHLALELKEGLEPHPEPEAVASVACQNFFLLYRSLCGISGTALAASDEFEKVYGLHVVPVPERLTSRRRDLPDRVHGSEQQKLAAVVEEVKVAHMRGQPVLVGTASVEASERFAALLEKEGFRRSGGPGPERQPSFQVLNAVNHEQEADIVANAGMPGAVTIATDMAGRGTDIVPGGGDPAMAAIVRNLGGLLVIGTERRSNRRIDDQLRGRTGRQGEPGTTVFHVSLEDEIYAALPRARVRRTGKRIAYGMPRSFRQARRLADKAQKTLAAREEAARMLSLKFEEVCEMQRLRVVEIRDAILDGDPVEEGLKLVRLAADMILRRRSSKGRVRDLDGLLSDFHEVLRLDGVADLLGEHAIETSSAAADRFTSRIRLAGQAEPFLLRETAGSVLAGSLDRCWREHREALETLKLAVQFRTLVGKDPYAEFMKDSYDMFLDMHDAFVLEAASCLAAAVEEIAPKHVDLAA